MQKFAIAVAAVALMTAAAPAVAGEAWRVGNNSYHLYFSDLDLRTTAGRAEALDRVEKVAAKLCGRRAVAVEQQACIAKTVSAATQGSAAPAIRLALTERGDEVVLAQAR
ncbi:MAG: hypothetical protein JWO33_375 [Caulobacteraceae bacterium]|nr:hypothetical protein [Caulobacteraceae bacterium]